VTPQDLQDFQDFVEHVNSCLQVCAPRTLLCSVLPSSILAFKFVSLTTAALVMKPRTEFLVTSALVCSMAVPAMFLLCGVIGWTFFALLISLHWTSAVTLVSA
jgi:hypothetical protein